MNFPCLNPRKPLCEPWPSESWKKCSLFDSCVAAADTHSPRARDRIRASRRCGAMATEIVHHKIEVVRNGKKFGTLWIGKQWIQWRTGGGKKHTNMTWKEFDRHMKSR